MTSTEERLERIEMRLKESQKSSRGAIIGGCWIIAIAILVNGCDPLNNGGAKGTRGDRQHVTLSTDSTLKVQLVDAVGRDVSFE